MLWLVRSTNFKHFEIYGYRISIFLFVCLFSGFFFYFLCVTGLKILKIFFFIKFSILEEFELFWGMAKDMIPSVVFMWGTEAGYNICSVLIKHELCILERVWGQFNDVVPRKGC